MSSSNQLGKSTLTYALIYCFVEEAVDRNTISLRETMCLPSLHRPREMFEVESHLTLDRNSNCMMEILLMKLKRKYEWVRDGE